MIDREHMVRTLIKEFSALEDDITGEDWTGLTQLEVSCFTRYTQQQIDNQDQHELKRCFVCARMLVMEGTADVKDAMYVSYLEHLNFADGKQARSWAIHALPEPLRSGLRSASGPFAGPFKP